MGTLRFNVYVEPLLFFFFLGVTVQAPQPAEYRVPSNYEGCYPWGCPQRSPLDKCNNTGG